MHGTDNAQPLVTQRNVAEIVQALLASLQDEPHIAEKVCYALSQLAAGSKQEDGLSLLSPYFKEIIQALLTTVRPSVQQQQKSAAAQAVACARPASPRPESSTSCASSVHATLCPPPQV